MTLYRNYHILLDSTRVTVSGVWICYRRGRVITLPVDVIISLLSLSYRQCTKDLVLLNNNYHSTRKRSYDGRSGLVNLVAFLSRMRRVIFDGQLSEPYPRRHHSPLAYRPIRICMYERTVLLNHHEIILTSERAVVARATRLVAF